MRLATVLAIAVGLGLFAPSGASAQAGLKRCSPIILAEQSGGNFTDIRVARIRCPVAHGVLARYLRAETRCVEGWTCTYAVRVPWTSQLRVKFARRGGYRIYFNIGSA